MIEKDKFSFTKVDRLLVIKDNNTISPKRNKTKEMLIVAVILELIKVVLLMMLLPFILVIFGYISGMYTKYPNSVQNYKKI